MLREFLSDGAPHLLLDSIFWNDASQSEIKSQQWNSFCLEYVWLLSECNIYLNVDKTRFLTRDITLADLEDCYNWMVVDIEYDFLILKRVIPNVEIKPTGNNSIKVIFSMLHPPFCLRVKDSQNLHIFRKNNHHTRMCSLDRHVKIVEIMEDISVATMNFCVPV